ncbi:unnamed protein product [Orchesella dallaii]|uniref:Uncharacterized protein n=1 Tax=Orchesella dallaii TaxID=48710 RepID=A0ABP1Q1C9_9HEXA
MAQNLWKWDSSEESDIEEDVHSPPPKQKKTSAHAEVTGEAVENPPISDALSNLQFNPGSSSSMENGEAKPKSSTSTDEFESTRSNPKKNVKSTQTAQDSQPQSKINANPTLKSATPAPITTPQLENRVVAAPDDPSTPSKWVSPFKLSKHELSNSTWFPYTATKGRVRGTGQPPRQTSAVANYQSRYVDYGTNNYLQPIRSPFRVPLPTQKQAYAEKKRKVGKAKVEKMKQKLALSIRPPAPAAPSAHQEKSDSGVRGREVDDDPRSRQQKKYEKGEDGMARSR